MNQSMKITEKTRAILRAEKLKRETSDSFVSMTSLMEEAVVCHEPLLVACRQLLHLFEPHDADERFLQTRVNLQERAKAAIAMAEGVK